MRMTMLLLILASSAGCAHRATTVISTATASASATATGSRASASHVTTKPTQGQRPRVCHRPATPDFPDTDRAIGAAPGLIDRVTRLRAGRDARIEYERQLESALESCR